METPGPELVQSVAIDSVEPIEVGPGCRLRMLPVAGPVEAWVSEIDAGCAWPEVDEHDAFGESYWVISGEIIEGDRRFGPGTYVAFGPHTRHRPRSETGVRVVGFNLL